MGGSLDSRGGGGPTRACRCAHRRRGRGRLASALRLARAGFGVVCLEQGSSPSEFPGSKPEWELLSSRQWHPNPNVRGRPADYPCETSDSDVNPLMWSGVGGEHDPLLGALGALLAVRLPRPVARRDRGRLALRLRRSRAVLRAGGTGLRGLRRGRRSCLSGGDRPTASHRCRSARSAGERPRAWTGSAGTGGLDPSRSPRALTETCVRAACAARASPAVRIARRPPPTSRWPEALERGVRLVTGARERHHDGRSRAGERCDVHRSRRERAPPGCRRRDRLRERGWDARLLQLWGSQTPPGLVGKRPDDASLTRQSSGYYDEPLESWLGPGGPDHPVDAVLRDGRVARLRARCQVAGHADGRAARPARGLRRQLRWRRASAKQPAPQHGASSSAEALEWGVIAEDLPDEDSNRVALAAEP